MWPLITRSTASSSCADDARRSAEPARLPSQPLMSDRRAGLDAAFVHQHDDGLDALRAQRRHQRVDGLRLVAEFAGPATPVGVTMPGVAFSVMPMKATGTPLKRLDAVGRQQRAAGGGDDDVGRQPLELRALEGHRRADLRALAAVRIGHAVASSLQPPRCRRSSSAEPLSNSWLPTALNSRPMRFSVSTAGSSWNSDEISGDAPIMSPAPTTTFSGFCAFSFATCAAMNSAPPTGGRCVGAAPGC